MSVRFTLEVVVDGSLGIKSAAIFREREARTKTDTADQGVKTVQVALDVLRTEGIAVKVRVRECDLRFDKRHAADGESMSGFQRKPPAVLFPIDVECTESVVCFGTHVANCCSDIGSRLEISQTVKREHIGFTLGVRCGEIIDIAVDVREGAAQNPGVDRTVKAEFYRRILRMGTGAVAHFLTGNACPTSNHTLTAVSNDLQAIRQAGRLLLQQTRTQGYGRTKISRISAFGCSNDQFALRVERSQYFTGHEPLFCTDVVHAVGGTDFFGEFGYQRRLVAHALVERGGGDDPDLTVDTGALRDRRNGAVVQRVGVEDRLAGRGLQIRDGELRVGRQLADVDRSSV